MSIELMLLAVNMNFIAFSYFLGDTAGQVFVFFILTVAAAEAAIGLAILVDSSGEQCIECFRHFSRRPFGPGSFKYGLFGLQPRCVS